MNARHAQALKSVLHAIQVIILWVINVFPVLLIAILAAALTSVNPVIKGFSLTAHPAKLAVMVAMSVMSLQHVLFAIKDITWVPMETHAALVKMAVPPAQIVAPVLYVTMIMYCKAVSAHILEEPLKQFSLL